MIGEERRGRVSYVIGPDGSPLTMAEMNAEQKAAVSHRGRAARRMAALLGLAA